MRKPAIKETEIAAPIVDYLNGSGWEVFQEVMLDRRDGSTADIVAVKNNQIWIIETKTNFGLTVISQANKWTHFCDYASVGIPGLKNSDAKELGRMICKNYLGIGVIEVYVNHIRSDVRFGDYTNHFRNEVQSRDYVIEVISPGKHNLTERNRLTVLSRLLPEHKTGEFAKAGSQTGNVLTPYKATMLMIRNWLETNPGATVSDIIGHVGTGHYRSIASAKANYVKALVEFERDWCNAELDKNVYRFSVKKE